MKSHFASLCALLVAASTATAQTYDYPYNHASTLEEGMARGISSLIRSAGEANLMHSQAALNYEQARSLMLDNRIKTATTYFETRQVNRERRFSELGASPELLFRINQERLPERLSPAQLDPVSGQIEWPTLLLQDRFAVERGVVEDAFAARASQGMFASTDQYLQLRSMLGRMREMLADYLDAVPMSDYNAARGFLASLGFEAHLSAQ